MPGMSFELTIPELGESIEEAQIVTWRKKEGDFVSQDEIVVDLETDKAALELPSPRSGRIEAIMRGEGETVAIGDVIARVSENGARADGEDAKRPAVDSDDASDPDAPAPGGASREPGSEAMERDEAQPDGAVHTRPIQQDAPPVPTIPRLTPDAKQLLSKAGLSADDVQGTGAAGRIVARDIDRAIRDPGAIAASAVPEDLVELSPLQKLRADHFAEAAQSIPQGTVFEEADIQHTLDMLEIGKASFPDSTDASMRLSAFVAWTAARAIGRFPELNAEGRRHDVAFKRSVHLAIHCETPAGYVMPIIRSAEDLSVAAIARAMADAQGRAAGFELTPGDLAGATFTITGDPATGPMLSVPSLLPRQSAVLAIHAVRERLVLRDEVVRSHGMLWLAMSYDCRVVDPVRAAAGIAHIKSALENPITALLRR